MLKIQILLGGELSAAAQDLTFETVWVMVFFVCFPVASFFLHELCCT